VQAKFSTQVLDDSDRDPYLLSPDFSLLAIICVSGQSVPVFFFSPKTDPIEKITDLVSHIFSNGVLHARIRPHIAASDFSSILQNTANSGPHTAEILRVLWYRTMRCRTCGTVRRKQLLLFFQYISVLL
jgi:hypothetical protein